MENNETIFSDIIPEETRASSFRVFFTKFIDFAADVVIFILLFKLVPRDIIRSAADNGSFIMLFIFIVTVTAYRFIFMLLFNKTLGMMICKVKLLNAALKPLSAKEKFSSLFRSWFSGIKYYNDK